MTKSIARVQDCRIHTYMEPSIHNQAYACTGMAREGTCLQTYIQRAMKAKQVQSLVSVCAWLGQPARPTHTWPW